MSFTTNIDEMKIDIHWIQELIELGNADATNLVGLQSSMRAAPSGSFSEAALQAMIADRIRIANVLSPESLRARLINHMLNLGETIGSPQRDPRLLLRDIQQHMDDNFITIPSRNLTFGSPAAGASNVGTGVIQRCTVDRFGYDIENIFVEAKKAEVILDQGAVTKHQEEFLITGTAFKSDTLDIVGSGMRATLRGIDARRVAQFVTNPSFDQHDVTVDNTAPTSITGWTVTSGSIANLRMRSSASYIYRGSQGVTTPWAIEFTDNVEISQIFVDNRDPEFSEFVPYYISIPVQRLASATGTVTLTMGSQTATVDLSTLTNGQYALLTIGPSSTSNWYENFKQDDMAVKVGVTSLATGTCVIDDLIVTPFEFIDGTFYIAHGGSTPWSLKDSYTWTDALVGSDSVIQKILWRSGLESLPHAITATQVTASGGRTLTFADANPDTITASSGSFISDGYSKGQTLTVAGTSSNNGTYTIASVTATVITLISTDTLVAEGPLSATATLDAAPTHADP